MASNIGSIGWLDLTVPDAETNKDFYVSIIGCTLAPTSMGDYNDYTIVAESGDGVAGVCHARGSNEGLPPMWLPYFCVASVEKSISQVNSGGGEIVFGPKPLSGGLFAAIKDPAGAYFAIWQESVD